MSRAMCVRSFASLGIAAVCALQGCTCGEGACAPPFEVQFAPSGERWLPGAYHVVVTADGVTGSCDVQFPFPNDSCDHLASCTGTRTWGLEMQGCSLPPSEQSIPGVLFYATAPAKVEIAVSREGRQLAEAAFTPIYGSFQNGSPLCGPACHAAPTATMALEP